MIFSYLRQTLVGSSLPRLNRDRSTFMGVRLIRLTLCSSLVVAAYGSIFAQKVLAEKRFSNQPTDNPQTNIQILDHQPSAQFASLQQKLLDYGFAVKLEIPPYVNRFGRKPYGLVRNQERTVWINPVVFDLGNELPVLIHEAVHAAQICAGGGNFSPLNLDLEAPQIASPYFLRYHNLQRKLEAEAYIVQTQPNSFELAGELLDRHCSP